MDEQNDIEITLTISMDKAIEIANAAFFKKITDNWNPAEDPCDWLVLQVIKAAKGKFPDPDPD